MRQTNGINRNDLKFFTPGVIIITIFACLGIFSIIYRLIFGLGAATNLDGQYPWGIWIGIDVASGVALAAGGFTSSFIAHIMHRERYDVITRPALLTALLGYTFVAIGVMIDLGRYYWIWHPIMPSMWQGNSALFEVGMCVMLYVTVLYIEFMPIVIERFLGKVNFPGILSILNHTTEIILRIFNRFLSKSISLFIIAGVVLSCMHQSSLGTLMAIVPSKLHPLWHTPILSLLFLMSAFSVGIAMVIFESILASRSLKIPFETPVLSQYARYIPLLLWIYLFAKVLDMVSRDSYVYLQHVTLESSSFFLEMVLGVISPILILSSRRLRKKVPWLFTGAALTIFGVLLNRINVFVIGYSPPYATERYVPSIMEILVTVGLISCIILLYRFFVFHFPVLHAFKGKHYEG